MRTTAVYGNGKFGIADRSRIAARPGLRDPFQAEMLTVWLIRGFTLELAEHIARARAPGRAVALAPPLRRHLGIGNATGLGMAPFLVNHPLLLHNWMVARERGLARVRGIERAGESTLDHFRALLARARRHVGAWNVEDARQMGRIAQLRTELAGLERLAASHLLSGTRPWERLFAATRSCSEECQELAVSLLLEPHGDLVDDLAGRMSSDVEPRLEPDMGLDTLQAALDAHFGWALRIDFSDPSATRYFWYVSEEKLEPRLGERRKEPGAEQELPLDIARQAQHLARCLGDGRAGRSVARLLLRHPELRYIVRRVQTAARHPYSEIRDNLIGAGCLPIDIMRCKLSFFGASRFDPRSDRWVRINMFFQGAPGFEDIGERDPDDWAFPVLAEARP